MVGAGGFFRAVKIDLGDCGDHKAFPSAVEAADLNHDKMDDLVVGLPGQLAILRGLGDGEAQSWRERHWKFCVYYVWRALHSGAHVCRRISTVKAGSPVITDMRMVG
jgi:hypothetical protein